VDLLVDEPGQNQRDPRKCELDRHNVESDTWSEDFDWKAKLLSFVLLYVV